MSWSFLETLHGLWTRAPGQVLQELASSHISSSPYDAQVCAPLCAERCGLSDLGLVLESLGPLSHTPRRGEPSIGS